MMAVAWHDFGSRLLLGNGVSWHNCEGHKGQPTNIAKNYNTRTYTSLSLSPCVSFPWYMYVITRPLHI